MVWWPKFGDCPPYGIRATQAHKGGDLELSRVYKRITLTSFHEYFGKDSRRSHCTTSKAGLSIAAYGLAPSGNVRLMEQPGALGNARPIHLASTSPGEWQQKNYPKQEIMFSYDPLILLRLDALREQEVADKNDPTLKSWCGFTCQPLGTCSLGHQLCTREPVSSELSI